MHAVRLMSSETLLVKLWAILAAMRRAHREHRRCVGRRWLDGPKSRAEMFKLLYSDLRDFDRHLRPALHRKWRVTFGDATATAMTARRAPTPTRRGCSQWTRRGHWRTAHRGGTACWANPREPLILFSPSFCTLPTGGYEAGVATARGSSSGLPDRRRLLFWRCPHYSFGRTSTR